MRISILCCVIALLGAAVQAEVGVEILDMPTEIYSFEPVYVLYAVYNTGQSPVYMPAEFAPHLGPGVYFAPAGETPRRSVGVIGGDRPYPHATKTMWLAPGERWLFYEDIGSWLGVIEGEVSVQAVMSSDGRCGDRQVHGRQSFPLAPLHLETFQAGPIRGEVYRCWQGEARSSVWSLTVNRPTSPVDLEAHDYLLEKGGALIHNREADTWRLLWASGLIEKYPTSHYAYAVLADGVSKPTQKMRAVELQPGNPLNPWVNGAIARHVLDYRSCRRNEYPRYDFDPERGVPDIEELEIPDALREYLDQHAWYLEHRHCPGVEQESSREGGKNR